MLIIDDLLFLPARSLFWIFREIHNAAKQELANDTESIATQLSNLYMMLETSRISQAEFETEEKVLLDRLDRLQERDTDLEAECEKPEEQGDAAEHVKAG